MRFCWRSWNWRSGARFFLVRNRIWNHRALLSWLFVHVIVCCFCFRLILPCWSSVNRSSSFLRHFDFVVRKLSLLDRSCVINRWRSWGSAEMLLINRGWFLRWNFSGYKIIVFLDYSGCWGGVWLFVFLEIEISRLSPVALCFWSGRLPYVLVFDKQICVRSIIWCWFLRFIILRLFPL